VKFYFPATTRNHVFVSVAHVFGTTAIRETTRGHRVASDGMTAVRCVLCRELLPSIGWTKKLDEEVFSHTSFALSPIDGRKWWIAYGDIKRYGNACSGEFSECAP